MPIQYEFRFLLALCGTVIAETAAAIVIIRELWKGSLPIHRLLAIGVLPSLLTLPYLWFIVPLFVRGRVLYPLTSEISAFLVETVAIALLSGFGIKRSAILSLLCNASSYVVGLVLQI